jgi:hypothetical protein
MIRSATVSTPFSMKTERGLELNDERRVKSAEC